MDDDDFDDLFDGGDIIPDSSQESLTNAAANLDFADSDNDGDEVMEGLDYPLSDRKNGTSKTSMTGVPEMLQACDPESRSERQPDTMVSSTNAASPSALTTVDSKCSLRESGLIAQRKVEAVFERITDTLLNDPIEISITLGTRPKTSSFRSRLPNEEPPPADEVKHRRICFPGKTATEAWRFTVIIRLLEMIHEALSTNVVVSKRDIYYRDPALFGSQAHVDRYVDDIAFTFGVPRSALNVASVAKGLVVGAISFCRRDGSTVNAAADREGMLVPSPKDVLSVDMSNVKWIIVIEKEASFRSIAASDIWDRLATEGVLITGKGYPDIATRTLLHFLSMPSPRNGFAAPPVFGLADFDPDGLAIVSVYKNGSVALAHESAALRVPQLKWLGLGSEHIMLGGQGVHARQGLLSLTTRDRKRARKMLEREGPTEDGDELSDEGRELQAMLMLNVKAELQLLNITPNSMIAMLEAGLGRK